MSERNHHIIVVGSAPCVLADIAAIPRVGGGYDVMAIGSNSLEHCPGEVRYVASYHIADPYTSDLQEIYRRRRLMGGNTDFQIISHVQGEGIHVVHPHEPPSGSSALLGTLAALEIGYLRIILCGCPMTGKCPVPGGMDYDVYQIGWVRKAGLLGNRVRSMSGWTREFLGMPTEEWLLGLEDHR